MTQPPSGRRPAAAQRRRYPLRRLVRANLYDLGLLLGESRLVLAAFALVALCGTLYLRFLYPGAQTGTPGPDGIAEALYETLKLLTLQSGLEFPTGDLLGGLVFFLTPLLGLALIFQSVLNFGRLLLDKGSRREAWQVALAATYGDHVIVCGLGRLGLRVVTQLVAAGHEPVVIERDWESEFVRRVLAFKVPVVLGDAREPEILRQAGVARARAIVATINDDLMNIEIALAARAIRPDLRVILRLFSEELDHNLERSLGPNTAFSASALAAPTFAAAAASREIDYVLPLAGAPLGVSQVVAQRDSRLSGFVRAVEEQWGIRVLHHQSAAGRAIPRAIMSQISDGDQLTVIGTLPAVEALRGANIPGSKLGFLAPPRDPGPAERRSTVIVCGLGKVGYRVVRQLWRLNPRPQIVVVRLNDDRRDFPQKIAQLDGVTTVLGDATDLAVLLRAGLDDAYSVAALTSDDLVNLQIGLAARRHRPDVQIVLRTFSDALAERLADLVGIRTTYSTSALAAPTLAAAGVIGDVRHAFYAPGGLTSSARVAVVSGHPFAGATVAAIREAHGALVVGLRRGASMTAVPPLDAVVTEGDEVTVLAPLEVLARVRGLRPGGRATTARLGRWRRGRP